MLCSGSNLFHTWLILREGMNHDACFGSKTESVQFQHNAIVWCLHCASFIVVNSNRCKKKATISKIKSRARTQTEKKEQGQTMEVR